MKGVNGEFPEVREVALRHLESARLLWVPASGEFLAEVPGYHWDFWALGETPEAATVELMSVIVRKLEARLVGASAKLAGARVQRSYEEVAR